MQLYLLSVILAESSDLADNEAINHHGWWASTIASQRTMAMGWAEVPCDSQKNVCTNPPSRSNDVDHTET